VRHPRSTHTDMYATVPSKDPKILLQEKQYPVSTLYWFVLFCWVNPFSSGLFLLTLSVMPIRRTKVKSARIKKYM
jgi:hypothetical protein